MTLRKQLLIVSLVSLVLPWAGVKYMREMEQTLRLSQVEVLEATSNAIAVVLASNPRRSARLGESSSAEFAGQRVVAHSFDGPIILDGYADEWRRYPWVSNDFQSLKVPFSGQYVLGLHDQTISLFMTVSDPTREFYNPSLPLQKSDFIRLYLPGEDASFDAYTSAPGRVSVFKNTGAGAVDEHGVEGFMQELPNGYQLELSLPLALFAGGLKVQVYDGAQQRVILQSAKEVAQVITQDKALNAALSPFLEVGTRLYVLDKSGAVLADVGSLETSVDGAVYKNLLGRMVRWVLGRDDVPAWQNAAAAGAFRSPSNGPLIDYLRQPSLLMNTQVMINRSAAKVGAESLLGYVVAERNSSAVNTLINGAAGRLLIYTITSSLIAGLLCILYASWLSWRIRRLSRLVDSALDEQGSVNTAVPNTNSTAKDEIGDLTRSYGELLARLHDYTEYLQNLASKLSHELRTPLAVVKSSLDNLLQLPDEQSYSKQTQQYAERALAGADRLSGILTAMSAANRIEQSLQCADKEVVDCAALLSELTQAYKDIYQGHELVYLQRTFEPCWVYISPDLFVQLLDKLLENAADFTKKGEQITVVISRTKNTVNVQVVNPGPPIAETMRAQIFDSLVSVRDAQHSSEGGTSHLGLGLYIVRLIASFHGAEVNAYNNSEEAKVVFEVALPAAAAP